MKTAPSKYAVTSVVIALAVAASLAMYHRYVTRPWTRDAQVRANVVGIACRVAGPILQIPVKDNQQVKKGDLLFEIDPATYIAQVNTSTGNLQQAEAKAVQAKQQLDRQTILYKTKVIDIRDLQDAQDTYIATQADVAAAQAALDYAKLSLSYTKIFAPVDGYLTNVDTSPGEFVSGGQGILALVDSTSFWVAAYFKETQLLHVVEGAPVKIRLMGHDSQPFDGVVESVAWGIFVSDGSTVQMLPNVSQTIDWVRLPNRFPVRVLVTGKPPVPLRIGQTASVSLSER